MIGRIVVPTLWVLTFLLALGPASVQGGDVRPAVTAGMGSIDEVHQRMGEEEDEATLLEFLGDPDAVTDRKLPDRSEWPLAPVPRTGQTRTYAIGDDGYHERGIPWPVPRFTDNDNGTVTDNVTGLVWLKTAGRGWGVQPWEEAVSICNSLADGTAGLSDGSKPGDWRLSNLREVASLADYSRSNPALPLGHPFKGVHLAAHWVSTSHPVKTYAGFRYATQAGLFGGFSGKEPGHDPVWPVRGGHDARHRAATAVDVDLGPPAPVLQTGQKQSLGFGDDGYHRCGLPLVPPQGVRFTDNRDGTVSDNLTGLIWLKTAAAGSGAVHWAAAVKICNVLGDGMAGLSDGSRPGDWRLPNVRELHALIDYAEHEPALPAGHPFASVISDQYWTSTTVPADPETAYSMHLMQGRLWNHNKLLRHHVWPVRGGL